MMVPVIFTNTNTSLQIERAEEAKFCHELMKQKFTQSQGLKSQGNKSLSNALASKKKVSKNQVVFFDYRDERKLKRFINDQGKIIPRRITGLSAKEQNLLTHSVKWARFLAVIPYVVDEYK